MASLSDVTSDIISISITLSYMVIVWVIVDKLKFFSGLLNIYKKPAYLLIILVTIIPIYSILKRLLNNKSPLNINIGLNNTGTRQIRQLAGTETKFIMPSDPEAEFRVADVPNKKVDEAKYADPIKGDKVAMDILDTNYHFGSPKDAKSRFILHGKICDDQDFLKNGIDENGDSFEMVRVKWDLIANQSPRYCKNPGCIEGGNLSKEYGAMKTNSGKFTYEEGKCTTPYRIYQKHRIVSDVNSNELDISMKKRYKTFGQELSEKQCMNACDDDNDCRGFTYDPTTKEVNFFGVNIVNNPNGILPNNDSTTTVYVKPPATSMVPLKSLLKPEQLPFCDPANSLCNPATSLVFAGKTFEINQTGESEAFCISLDEIDANPLGPTPPGYINLFQQQGKVPAIYVRVVLSNNPSECFAMRRASLRNGKMPYFKFLKVATTNSGEFASPLSTECCANDPSNTPNFAKEICPKTARVRMGGGENIPDASSCETQECSILGQYCPPSAPGSTPNGKRCCSRDGRFLWRDGSRACSYLDRSYDIPNATSCSGWDCDIEGQYCPPGVEGSTGFDEEGYRCCKGKWRRGASSC